MWRKRITVWLVLLLAGGGSLLGGEPVPEADSIVLGLMPVLPVSDRTDAAGEEDGFYVYSELGFRLVWGGIAVYLDFGVDKLRPYLMDDQGNRLVFDSLLEALNYLSARGWDLAEVYPEVDDGDSSACYLMRKKLCDFTLQEREIYDSYVRR